MESQSAMYVADCNKNGQELERLASIFLNNPTDLVQQDFAVLPGKGAVRLRNSFPIQRETEPEELAMKAMRIPNEMESKAAEALGALLHQVSAIRTREIRFQPERSRCNILASIDVLGRSHRLVCGVSDGEPKHVRAALTRLRSCSTGRKANATQVLIASSLSPQARALCEDRHVAFVDLEGNARLMMDEVLIGQRAAHPHGTEVPAN